MRKAKMQAVNLELLGIIYQQERAIDRVRELHYKDGGLCGYCQNLANPDEDSGNWYMVYYPCPTIKALDGDSNA